MKILDQLNLKKNVEKLCLTQPFSYLDMVALEKNSRAIIIDSGGVQKEAYYHNVPCITLRDETEWTETVDAGWNSIVGSDFDQIVHAVQHAQKGSPITEYGTGNAAEITKNRGIAICAPIAPYEKTRAQIRESIEAHGGFFEVHVSTPITECEKRDRKGMYAKARAGLLKGFI